MNQELFRRAVKKLADGRFWKPLAFGAIGAGIIFFAGLLWLLHPDPYTGPSFEEVHRSHSQSETLLLDRHGAVLHEYRTDNQGRRLEWTPLKDSSPALLSAMLFAEDRRFYRHHGVDWTALLRASLLNFHARRRGASTISMQLAAKLDADLHPARQRRTFRQKWRQIQRARSLERGWSKAQILEAYLNLTTFRGELQGVSSAAEGLFHKKAHGLTQDEAVLLAALVRAPNADVKTVIRRASGLSDSMNLGIPHAAIAARANATLNRPYLIRPDAALAYHVMQRLLREARNQGAVPSEIVCTLDREVQQLALDTLRRQIVSLHAQNVRDGAVLVLDNRTGDVLAYAGNTGTNADARYVDGVQALRQAGSTLKPFIYGAALDQKILTAATRIEDSPVDIPATGGLYRPENYDQQFHGPVSVRTALASSLNIPAVKALNLIGVEPAVRLLTAAGFESLEPAEFYGLSLALGAAEVKLWELTNAYRCLANGGQWTPIRLTAGKTEKAPHRVLSSQAAFIISDILSDRESRSRTFSLESPLATRFRTAVKTGTSKDMRDNWCIGFSSRYTVGVWVGNFTGAPMWNVSGITGAAPVWVEIMNWLHRDGVRYEPDPPAGIVSGNASDESGAREWFIRGTENALAAGSAKPAARIVYPAANTVIALDPNIPYEDQKLFFEAGHSSDTLQWSLDGRRIGAAGALLLWTPVPGRHALALMDAAGRTMDAITFEVRGQ